MTLSRVDEIVNGAIAKSASWHHTQAQTRVSAVTWF